MTGVLICGMPWSKPDWSALREQGHEIWGINDAWRVDETLPDFATRWFEMHQWKRTLRKRTASHIAWLKADHDFPIYMPRRVRGVKNSVVYPLDEARKLVPERLVRDGKTLTDVFGDSFCYMIALAMMEGLNPIMLYYVNLTNFVEAYLELSSLSFWVGLAAAAGFTVRLSSDGAVVPEQLYGYDERYAPEWAWFLKDEVEYVEGRKKRPKTDLTVEHIE